MLVAEFSEIRGEQNKEQLCTGLTCWVMAEAPCPTQAQMPRQGLAQHCDVAVNYVSFPSLPGSSHHKHLSLRQLCVALLSVSYQHGDDGHL